MANPGYLESLIHSLPTDLRPTFVAFVREAFKTLAFGSPSDVLVAAENFAGALVPYTTSGTPNAEVAVAHGLARVPRIILTGVLAPNTVNATNPVITLTKAADATYVYLSSATATASGWLFVG